MFLLDTNVWLERLLNQARAPEVKQLLARQTPAQVLAALPVAPAGGQA